jgi:RNA polymerase sigma factor (sigma-70 family)
MRARSKLSKKRQAWAVEYMPLATMLAKFFVQTRPGWQKAALIPDLEAEGFLALTRAARTYDPKKLKYPKAYFARAIMNGMYKYIKKATRAPGDWKISIQEAEDLLPLMEHPDHLRLAIEDLPEDERRLAEDRFQDGQTLRTIAEGHQISLRVASVKARALANQLAASLDIRLQPRGSASVHQKRGSSQTCSSSPRASGDGRKRPRSG